MRTIEAKVRQVSAWLLTITLAQGILGADLLRAADPEPNEVSKISLVEEESQVLAHDAYPVLVQAFSQPRTRRVMAEAVRLMHPELIEDADVEQFINDFPIVVSQHIDDYIWHDRRGSSGSTLMEVDADGSVHFRSMSFVQSHLESGTLSSDLVAEEFLQALQYEALVAPLFNQGYLRQVAGIDTPEQLIEALTNGNLRAFLELPQQAFLYERGVYSNSYFFTVGDATPNHYGNPISQATVNLAFEEMQNIIRHVTRSEYGPTPTDLMSPLIVTYLNDRFRFQEMGTILERYPHLSETDVNLWSYFGLTRQNVDPNLSLSIPSLIN